MSNSIPDGTIRVFAKTICDEAAKYGFEQVDVIRLINAMMDISTNEAPRNGDRPAAVPSQPDDMRVSEFPLRSPRLAIRPADPAEDKDLLNGWMADQYGRYFLLSSATAQPIELDKLLTNARNEVGIVLGENGEPIGAVAYLDIDPVQKRAELRKVIGVPAARGKGLAEEATRLWIEYGGKELGLEKIYVSTLQTHLRNIQLNESIGFRVEGVLHREVLISGTRHDVLRMGLCFDELAAP